MKVAESVSYSVLIIGSTLDHIGTRIALTYPHIYEINPFTRWLIAHNLWLPVDISFLLLLILTPSIIINEKNLKGKIVITLTPLIIGIVRLILAVWNFMLLG